jgi:DNA-binding NarL/FixJ family response regulator
MVTGHMSLRLLLADDEEVVRACLRTLIECRSGWQIVGEAADGLKAVSRVFELAPDVVILDLAMPVMNGAQAAKEIRRIAPATKIILFSAHDPKLFPGDVAADAFVSKVSADHDLIPTIERLTNSRPQIPRTVRSKA